MVFAGHVHYHVQSKPEDAPKKERSGLLSNLLAAVAGGLISYLLHRNAGRVSRRERERERQRERLRDKQGASSSSGLNGYGNVPQFPVPLSTAVIGTPSNFVEGSNVRALSLPLAPYCSLSLARMSPCISSHRDSR
eukprot:CAMPEP_0118942576 /NCGR_PEP_ID=MMETSP1169-20130426/36449_1 /TAXON_ID=36882 /ORGANISM="Pyramimonas obovata, Strain CCMP722" /LENGTH=135 /DNA_ID=CAMNT_0006887617 /DNA_START=302 /DNA_END=706 /DNA_ORIENTATION=+